MYFEGDGTVGPDFGGADGDAQIRFGGQGLTIMNGSERSTLQNGGPRFPREITEAFTLVNDWSTDMRYLPRTLKADEAEGFLSAAENIIRWADGRI